MDVIAESEIFLFDRFRLDRRAGGLFRCDEHGVLAPVAIGSRALDVLSVLVGRHGRLVSKAEIMAAVWPRIVVADSNLPIQILALRRVLDHGRDGGSCIQTVAGRGYRFVVSVKRDAGHELAEKTEAVQASTGSGERRPITVLAGSIVGFPPSPTEPDPEELLDTTTALYRACADTISRHDGFVAHLPGDPFLAYFGYPAANEDDAERAVRTGLKLVDVIGRFEAPSGLQAHIGIASGLVVIGDVIGKGEGRQLSVIGATPSLAARLQALAKPNTVLIAESTQRQVGVFFELHELPSVGPAQRVWQALGERRGLGRFEALHSRNTPLVGREEETALLVRLWARVKAGDGHAVLLSGEPGVGKSRLAAELEERVRHERHHWLRYFCSPYHHHSALYPIIAQLERAAGFDGDDTPELKLEKLGTLVAPLSPPEDIALLADLLSLPGPTRYPPLDFTPQRKKEKTLGAWLRQIEALSRQQPVLIVFEDLQWIDPTSRVMLDLIIERLALWRVLLVATFRPEFQPPWVGQPQVTMLALNRLDRRDRTALVEQIAGGKSLPDQVINLIADKTDGVPLFVEELTKHVLESGLLREEQDRYVADSPLPRLAIPATLHASLTARLDRLGPAAREVAQLGAVLGREFTYQLAHQVANCADLDTALGQLTAAGLLLCRGALPQSSYLFKHALVQEAGYGILLRGRRQELHGRTAAVLEEQFAELVERRPELLAHHHTEAGNTEQAVLWWQKAGQQAVRLSGNIEAVAYFGRAVKLISLLPESLERDLRELEIRIELGTALFGTKGYAATELAENYARAWTLCERSDSIEHALAVLWGQYLAEPPGKAFMPGQTKKAERFVQLTQRQGDAGLQVIGHRMLGGCLVSEGEFIAGRRHLERGVALYDWEKHKGLSVTFGAINPCISCLATLSLVLQYLGYPDQAAKSVASEP